MAIVNGYATLAELKATLGVTDTDDDALLERAVEGASRRIDGHCHRRFYADAAATARLYRPVTPLLAFVNDISTTTGLVVEYDSAGDGTYATTVTDYLLEPLNAFAEGRPAEYLTNTGASWYTRNARPPLRVTARWGWPSVPHAVREACVLMAGRMFKRREALLGVAGFGELGAIAVRPVDPDIVDSLSDYVAVTGIA